MDIEPSTHVTGSHLRLWAKSGTETKPSVSLLTHMLDVGVAFDSLLDVLSDRRRSDVLRCVGGEAGRPLALVVAALHDIGKAAPVFQVKWRPGLEVLKQAGVTMPPYPVGPRHDAISEMILRNAFRNTIPIDPDVATIIARAIGAHHGIVQRPSTLKSATDALPIGGPEWEVMRNALIERVVEAFQFDPSSNLNVPHAIDNSEFVALAALISVADWIGSSLPPDDVGPHVQAYVQRRAEFVRQFIDDVGFRRNGTPESLRTDIIVFGAEAKPDGAALRPLQQLVHDVCQGVSGPVTLIIEAPMGEGKTEASFIAEQVLSERLGHDGMYVAMPTQATSNQMFSRVRSYLANRYGNSRVELQLLHGGSDLVDEFQEILVSANDGSDENDVDDAVSASQWFVGGRRGFLAAYAVGTIDQALLAVLPIKHNFVRLWGLSNNVVVIDEAHAYDTYTSDLLVHLVEWLREMGASVIIMSATLPNAVRQKLLASSDIEEKSYPRISVRDGGRVWAMEFAASARKTIDIVPCSTDLDSVADLLLGEAQRGQCVVAIMNTVQRAQRLFQVITNRTTDVALQLFHARYPGIWRREIEQQVVRLYGKDGDRPRSSILIATQVVEQSLDVDFDLMYSDLCPVDLLLQRSGRLHRHVRPRTDNKARLFVGGLHEVANRSTMQSIGVRSVYAPWIALRTAVVLHDRTDLVMPDDIDALVQRVYSDERNTMIEQELGIKEAVDEAYVSFMREDHGQMAKSREAQIPLPKNGGLMTNNYMNTLSDDLEETGDDHVVARTRLGERGVTIVPLVADGDSILSLSGEHVNANELMAKSRSLRTHSLRLPLALTTEACRSLEGSISGWRRCPRLRGLVPVIFRNNRAELGGYTLALDRLRGVVMQARTDTRNSITME